MRLSERQIAVVRDIAREEAGESAQVRVFGSRSYDELRGGDLDLLVELPVPAKEPAWLSALVSARISRLLGGDQWMSCSAHLILSICRCTKLPAGRVSCYDPQV